MPKSIVIVLFIVLSSALNICYAQTKQDSLTQKYRRDTLVLTDGNTIITSILYAKDTMLVDGNKVIKRVADTTEGVIKYLNPKNNKKAKTIEIDDVFSLRNKSGETVLYTPNPLDSVGENYSVTEMRDFISGSQAGKQSKVPYLPVIANFLLSAGAGATGSFFSPLAPFAFTALFALPKIKMQKEHLSNPALIDNEAYIAGYKQQADRKRKIHTLLGGGAGVVVGLVTSLILSANNIYLFQ